MAQLLADSVQLGGGCVADFPVAVQNALDFAAQFREGIQSACHPFQLRIDSILDRGEESAGFPADFQQGAKLREGKCIYGTPFRFQRFQKGDCVYVSRVRESVLEHYNQPHLVSELKPAADSVGIGAELLLRHPAGGIFGLTAVGNQFPDLVKPQLRFQSLGCRHLQ